VSARKPLQVVFCASRLFLRFALYYGGAFCKKLPHTPGKNFSRLLRKLLLALRAVKCCARLRRFALVYALRALLWGRFL
jgi:hypothetical protein